MPESRLGRARAPGARARGSAGQALGGSHVRASAGHGRSGRGLARADESHRRERGPNDGSPLRFAPPEGRRHRPDDRADAELEVARSRLLDGRRDHALPEPSDRGGLHDPRPGAGRRPRLGDDAARALRLVHERDPDRVRGRTRRQGRRRRGRGRAPRDRRERRRCLTARRDRTRRQGRPDRAAPHGLLRDAAGRERRQPHRARERLHVPGRGRGRPRARRTRATSMSTS